MYKQKIKVTVVNFRPEWGEVQANLKKMAGFIESARGTDIIVFPETALTGYDNMPDVPAEEKMHIRTAEKVPGPSTGVIAEIAARHNMTVVFGMVERDAGDPGKVYNAAAVVRPDGEIFSYRKIHLPGDEGDWAAPGRDPMVFDTEWGPVGLTICYDTYSFPELIRYARAKGARLHINCTACSEEVFEAVPLQAQLEERALTNQVYIATAGICGEGPRLRFVGGSSIIGTSDESSKAVRYYAGGPFGGDGADREAAYSAELDLEAIDKRFHTPMFTHNPRTGRPDFAPDIYARMYAELSQSDEWKEKSC